MNSTNPRTDPPILGPATLPLAHGNARPVEHQVHGIRLGTAQRSAGAVAAAAERDTLARLAPPVPTQTNQRSISSTGQPTRQPYGSPTKAWMKTPAKATENPHPPTLHQPQALQTVASSSTRNPTNHMIPQKTGHDEQHTMRLGRSLIS